MTIRTVWAAAAVLSWALSGPAEARQQQIPDFLERYHKILNKAYANSQAEMQYAQSKGAVFTPMPNGDGLRLYWEPAGAHKAKKLVVILPDADSDAWKEFRFWHPLVERRDTALLIPQWESGPVDLLQTTPQTLYPTNIQPVFLSKGFAKGSGLLYAHGKRAMFNYGMASLDRRKGGGQFFGAVIVDDGPADLNDSIVKQVNSSASRHVYNGSQWVLYCSTDCEAMGKTGSWLLFHGAKVELYLKETDKKGTALREQSDRLKTALDLFLPPQRKEEPAAPVVTQTVTPAPLPAEPAPKPAKVKKSTQNFAKKR